MIINYRNRAFEVLETRVMSTGIYGRINISSSDRAAFIWQLLPKVAIEHVIPDYDWPVEAYIQRKPLLVVPMPAELMASIRQALYCNIRVAA